MADPRQVSSYRTAYSKKSRGELIEIMHEFVSHSEMHIAARQLLEEMDKRDTDERYRNIEKHIIQLQKPHWTVNPGFWVSLLAVVLSGLAAFFAWLAIPAADRPYFHLPASVKTSSSSTPTPAVSPLPSQTPNAP